MKDNRLLNVHDLDQVSKDHPVAVHHRGGHTSFYNSKALEMADINKNTPNPPGGTFDRDANGDLNGRVTDRATGAFNRVGKRPTFTAEQTLQRDRDGLAYISKQFVRYGLTSVHHEGGDLFALQQVRARGDLLHRVSYEASGKVLEAMIAGGIATGFGDEWIRFGATSEHTVDGSFSERTMALSTPYPGVTPPYKGNITETQDDLNAWIERVHRAGIQVNCHANGDVAIDMVLTAVERAQRLFPRADARPKITHCTLINDDLVRRIKAAGVVPAPFTSYAYYNSDKFHFYGEELMKRCMAYRTFLDAGIRGGGGLGLQSGPVRPADGHSGNGDAHRLGWRDLGRQPADQRGRGAAGQHASTAPTTHTRKRSKDPSRRANWRTSWSWRTIFTRWTRRRSRTSRSSARWWAARRSTRRNFVKWRLGGIFRGSSRRTYPEPAWWRGGLGGPEPSRRNSFDLLYFGERDRRIERQEEFQIDYGGFRIFRIGAPRRPTWASPTIAETPPLW